MRAIRRFTVRTVLPESLSRWTILAGNLRWSWHPPTRDLFAEIDPKRWERVHARPGRPARRGHSRSGSRSWPPTRRFVGRVQAAADDLARYCDEPRWYQSLGADAAPTHRRRSRYFSPEFGIAEALPQYSGGLGILAGDHLKAASDLGVPIIGVGLFYRAGYFKQSISRDGWQQETYPVLDPRRPAADPAARRGRHAGAGRARRCRRPHAVWPASGRRRSAGSRCCCSTPTSRRTTTGRGVTDRLYGGGGEHRLLQELLLGIGGVRALRAWSRLTGAPAPEVFHTNEGHAGLPRASSASAT